MRLVPQAAPVSPEKGAMERPKYRAQPTTPPLYRHGDAGGCGGGKGVRRAKRREKLRQVERETMAGGVGVKPVGGAWARREL